MFIKGIILGILLTILIGIVAYRKLENIAFRRFWGI